MDRQTEKHKDVQEDIETYRLTDNRDTELNIQNIQKHKDEQTNTQMDGQTEKQADRETLMARHNSFFPFFLISSQIQHH